MSHQRAKKKHRERSKKKAVASLRIRQWFLCRFESLGWEKNMNCWRWSKIYFCAQYIDEPWPTSAQKNRQKKKNSKKQTSTPVPHKSLTLISIHHSIYWPHFSLPPLFAWFNSPTLAASIPSLPPISLSLHRSCDLAESRNVATSDQTRKLAFSRLDILLCRLKPVLETSFHDAFEFCVNFFRRPGYALGILGHFKTRDSNTPGICCFS